MLKELENFVWTDQFAFEAKSDYCQAFWWVYRNHQDGDTISDLCKKCGGHDCDSCFFDLRYKHAQITVLIGDDNKLRIYKEFKYFPTAFAYTKCNIEEFVDF